MSVGDSSDIELKPCYEQGALMRQFEFVSTLVNCMEELGWGPYQADHEDGNGQFEVNWDYDECLLTADRMAFSKCECAGHRLAASAPIFAPIFAPSIVTRPAPPPPPPTREWGRCCPSDAVSAVSASALPCGTGLLIP